jgi:predicted TIM-barrel fold metal-dependent hydrolase
MNHGRAIPIFISIGFLLASPIQAQDRPKPVIDMHMHGYKGELSIPNPNTGKILVHNGDEHRRASIKSMVDLNVVLGAVSANADPETASQILRAWRSDAGERLLKGLFFGKKAGYPPIDFVKNLIAAGEIDFLGEMGFQYDGRSASEPGFFEYYELALEFDIPVGIHTGMAAPETPNRCCPNFRLSLGNPYLLEDVLVRYPDLRIWAMHAGGHYFNEMVTMMTMYPRLYVDISPYTWLESGNDALLDRFLKLAKEQGVLDRVMFGSDQMRWPEAIEMAIQRVKSIEYLTDSDKAGILYDNAARFLRLSSERIAAHHAN